ncbi:MAG: phage holin family protein [Bacteroidota bacterium]|nr:phage holin family protein [Bacteroidota bacterium]MDP4226040.1 phage holin family protein [Bacteroidota bacterium]MDP4274763.1 phage holin family protein [Bacteroidota bacterium]
MEEGKQNFFEEMQQLVKNYVNDRLLLIKMQTAEKSAHLVSFLVYSIVIGFLGFFILLFLGMMTGYYFATITKSLFWGFAIVSAFFLVILAVIIIFRKKLFERIVGDKVVKIFFEKTEEK